MSHEVPSPGAAPERHARLLDTLNVMLVLGALGVVLLAALPSVLRAGGLIGERPPSDGPRPSHLALPQPPPVPTARPFFGPTDDDDEEPERALIPPRSRDRSPDVDGPDRPAPRVHDPEGAGETRARIGVVRHKIALFEQPAARGRPLGEVQPGEMVMVIKEEGDHALIAYSGDNGVLMGWAKTSEIAIR